MRSALAGAGLALAVFAAPSPAAIPSCYAMTKIEAPPPPLARDVFVLIDQTTPMDGPLIEAVRQTVGPLLVPGTGFTIATFSAFAQGRYLTPLATGRLEQTVAAGTRNDISVRKLEELDGCLAKQLAFGRRIGAKAIQAAVAGQSDVLAHSDVISSLDDLGKSVAASPAPKRVIIVVSDMIENSGITSFYVHGDFRLIDPKKELKIVETKDFIADFAGADVYVIGAGALPKGKSFRDPVSMKALERFWTDWFRKSKARLVDFGKPMPNVPVR